MSQSYLVIPERKQSNICLVVRKQIKIHVSINTFYFWDLRSLRDWRTFLRFHVLVPVIIEIEAIQLCWVLQVQPRTDLRVRRRLYDAGTKSLWGWALYSSSIRG